MSDTNTNKPARVRGPNGHFLPRAAVPVTVEPTVAVETPAEVISPVTVEAVVAEPVLESVPVLETAIETPAAVAATQEKITMATKIQDTVKTQADAFVAQGKAAYEQASTRAKSAFEQVQKAAGELNDFNKGNVEAIVASNKAAFAGVQTMAQASVAYTKTSVEKTTAVVKTLAASKSPNEFMTTGTEFAKAQFDAAVAELSKSSETFLKILGEVFEPLSNRMALAADKVAKAGAR